MVRTDTLALVSRLRARSSAALARAAQPGGEAIRGRVCSPEGHADVVRGGAEGGQRAVGEADALPAPLAARRTGRVAPHAHVEVKMAAERRRGH